jgi:hypothetical protein
LLSGIVLGTQSGMNPQFILTLGLVGIMIELLVLCCQELLLKLDTSDETCIRRKINGWAANVQGRPNE